MRFPRTSDAAAYARNWRTVLLADGALGVGLAAVGGVLVVAGQVWGVALAFAGGVYAALVGSRYRRWRRLRVEAGLEA